MAPVSSMRGWGSRLWGWSGATAAVLVAGLVFAGCAADRNSFGLTGRANVPTLGFPIGTPTADNVSVVRAFPALSFSQPLFLTAPPDGSDRIFVVEKGGTIRVFPNVDGASTTTQYFNIAVDTDGEQGLLGLAFSPNYSSDGAFYVYYTAPNAPRRSVVSRFLVSSDPDVADLGSEEILLEIAQPFTNHNAGMLAFGPDGFLYISLGDGGSGGDPFGNAQNRTTLLGSLLRIDPDGGTPYAVPADNPFVGEGGGVREEIYAFGLRNPWRFSFDRDTGDLWLGDVGQGDREEIDLVNSGDNLGWNLYEGNLEFDNPTSVPASALRAPVHDYSRIEGASVTGGYVYRGTASAALDGAYIYGDFASGTIWALLWDGTQVASNTPIGTVGSVASFGEDESGELFAVSIAGTIWRFIETGPPPPPLGGAPTLLSETGIFADLTTLQVNPGLIEYDVQVDEWADGARLRRWIFLPGTSQIDFTATSDWEFPVGTVLVKHFEIDLDATAVRRLETRVLVRDVQQWRFHLYRWNPEETDAELDIDGHDESLTVDTDAGPLTFNWHYPAPAECVACHSGAAGRVLGVRTRQMNRDFAFPKTVDNQLRAWNHVGLFTTNIGAAPLYPLFPDPFDPGTPLATAARVLLAIDCAICHRPGGSAPAGMDLRFDVPSDAKQLIGVAPSSGDLGLPGALLVTPGDRTMSILYERMSRLDATRMAPTSGRLDESGLEIIGDWIDGLP